MSYPEVNLTESRDLVRAFLDLLGGVTNLNRSSSLTHTPCTGMAHIMSVSCLLLLGTRCPLALLASCIFQTSTLVPSLALQESKLKSGHLFLVKEAELERRVPIFEHMGEHIFRIVLKTRK